MPQLMPVFVNGLVLLGLLVLISALLSIRPLIQQLPAGRMRTRWYLQSVLVLLFIVGYLAYAVVFWKTRADLPDLLVPGIFFCGAVYVWITISLALETTSENRRTTILEQESITDSLTGVYNRRYLDRRLVEEFDRARRYNHDLSLLLVDIDHFKRINDRLGHPTGDQVLRQWAAHIQGTVRQADIVARYGGEEILIIAPDTPPPAAFLLAERIRAKMETHPFALRSHTGAPHRLSITVSIGVSSLQPATARLSDLFEAVDRALYSAKHAGRNRVAVASQAAGGSH